MVTLHAHAQDNCSSSYTIGEQEAIHSTLELGLSGDRERFIAIFKTSDVKYVSIPVIVIAYFLI